MQRWLALTLVFLLLTGCTPSTGEPPGQSDDSIQPRSDSIQPASGQAPAPLPAIAPSPKSVPAEAPDLTLQLVAMPKPKMPPTYEYPLAPPEVRRVLSADGQLLTYADDGSGRSTMRLYGAGNHLVWDTQLNSPVSDLYIAIAPATGRVIVVQKNLKALLYSLKDGQYLFSIQPRGDQYERVLSLGVTGRGAYLEVLTMSDQRYLREGRQFYSTVDGHRVYHAYRAYGTTTSRFNDLVLGFTGAGMEVTSATGPVGTIPYQLKDELRRLMTTADGRFILFQTSELGLRVYASDLTLRWERSDWTRESTVLFAEEAGTIWWRNPDGIMEVYDINGEYLAKMKVDSSNTRVIGVIPHGYLVIEVSASGKTVGECLVTPAATIFGCFDRVDPGQPNDTLWTTADGMHQAWSELP